MKYLLASDGNEFVGIRFWFDLEPRPVQGNRTVFSGSGKCRCRRRLAGIVADSMAEIKRAAP